MVSGGARARSGPAPDPYSGRSERRNIKLADLPQSYDGVVPKYPLKKYEITAKTEDGDVFVLEKESRRFNAREKEIWAWLWTFPQANAWALPQYSFLLPEIALYCRQYVLCESSSATTADRGLLPRYADRIGLSHDGMTRLGWRVRPDMVAVQRLNKVESDSESEVKKASLRRRKIVSF